MNGRRIVILNCKLRSLAVDREEKNRTIAGMVHIYSGISKHALELTERPHAAKHQGKDHLKVLQDSIQGIPEPL